MTLPVPPANSELGTRYEVQAYSNRMRCWNSHYSGKSARAARKCAAKLDADDDYGEVRIYSVTLARVRF